MPEGRWWTWLKCCWAIPAGDSAPRSGVECCGRANLPAGLNQALFPSWYPVVWVVPGLFLFNERVGPGSCVDHSATEYGWRGVWQGISARLGSCYGVSGFAISSSHNRPATSEPPTC